MFNRIFVFIYKSTLSNTVSTHIVRQRSAKTYPIVRTFKAQMRALSNLAIAYNILSLITHSRHLLNVWKFERTNHADGTRNKIIATVARSRIRPPHSLFTFYFALPSAYNLTRNIKSSFIWLREKRKIRNIWSLHYIYVGT